MGKLDARLFRAIKDKEAVLACSLVEQFKDVNSQNYTRDTALHSSVLYNDLDVAGHLLNRGGKPMLMPKTLVHANRHECALLVAMKMGRSHETMQIMLLRALRSTLSAEIPDHKAVRTPYELQKIALLPHYAFLWGTPSTFYAAIEHDGNAIPHSNDETTPFMALLRNLVTFEIDIVTCREKMEDAWQIIARHPENFVGSLPCCQLGARSPNLLRVTAVHYTWRVHLRNASKPHCSTCCGCGEKHA